VSTPKVTEIRRPLEAVTPDPFIAQGAARRPLDAHALTTHPGGTTIDNGHDSRPTLVLGATGKTGRRVVQRLTERGRPVRIGSRRAEPPFDRDDRST
jgi:hypothetical protein